MNFFFFGIYRPLIASKLPLRKLMLHVDDQSPFYADDENTKEYRSHLYMRPTVTVRTLRTYLSGSCLCVLSRLAGPSVSTTTVVSTHSSYTFPAHGCQRSLRIRCLTAAALVQSKRNMARARSQSTDSALGPDRCRKAMPSKCMSSE